MSDWLICPRRRLQPRVRLFCFAYAGGSAWIFRPWAEQLPDWTEICAIELPGRGKRLMEPAFTDLSAIVQALGPQLLPYLNRPFAFFGHSLGALVAFELCRWLRRSVQLSPMHFWASAARAPHLPANRPLVHNLPQNAFIAQLKAYDGTPTNVLENEELMELMLPILRADFTVLETYRYQAKAPLSVPITGFWGTQDNIVSTAEVASWEAHTARFSSTAIPGNHFFMQNDLFPQRLLPTLVELVE